jgi:dTDP-4-amino-4,6-dideoxygalactose transaminase
LTDATLSLVLEQSTQRGVPFLDLAGMHAELKGEVLARLEALIERSEFGTGAAVREFEEGFAEFCGATDCVGVASGLDALRFLLEAAGVGAGDEVVVPAMTFVATFEAVSQVGATPVPVDVSSDDYTIVPAAADAAAGPRTRVLLPVHLYGQLADMRSLVATAERHGLTVIEDACQAHGAVRAGARPGHGTAGAAFSFYPGKNLGAMGDAGAVVTEDPAMAGYIRMAREHGQREKYRHELIGWTSRLDAFQAAVLATKLPHLDGWNAERRAVARLYGELLAGVGDLALPSVAPESEPVWHLYVVRTRDPAALAAHLETRSIATGRHYPVPPHLTDAYTHLGYAPGAFPVAEELARTALSLPVFPGMTQAQVEAVTEAIEDYFRSS